LVNTPRRYLVTKTKCTCIKNMQWRPCLISLSVLMDQNILSAMERLQAFKFELMPTGEQARKMRQFAGACRFAYNKALALQKETKPTRPAASSSASSQSAST
jgi:putative transposase